MAYHNWLISCMRVLVGCFGPYIIGRGWFCWSVIDNTVGIMDPRQQCWEKVTWVSLPFTLDYFLIFLKELCESKVILKLHGNRKYLKSNTH